jgi:hypothetical protein
MVIHQGIINPYDTVFPQGIIVAFFRPHIMPISKTLEEIVKDVGAGGDHDIDQFHFDHISNDVAHPSRNHRPRQPQKDDAGRILKHLSENFKTSEEVSALKRSVLEGLDQIEKTCRLFEVYMLDRSLKKFGFSFFHLCRQADEFLRKLSNKNREVKENDPFLTPQIA